MAEQARNPFALARRILWVAVFLAAGFGLYLWFAAPVTPDGNVTSPADADFSTTVGGPFQLTAADGTTVTEKALAGKPYAIFFGFTRCPDVCPTTLQRMARLRKELGKDGGKFRIVFVSVDPGHDSPGDIGRYIDLFGTPILGLTGTEDQIAQVTKAYHAYYKKVPQPGGDYTIDHTAGVYLMDAKGQLSGIIDFEENEETALAKLRNLIA